VALIGKQVKVEVGLESCLLLAVLALHSNGFGFWIDKKKVRYIVRKLTIEFNHGVAFINIFVLRFSAW